MEPKSTELLRKDPDVSLRQKGKLVAVIEIKGGTDPAGALQRYAAATKSFEHAMTESPKCATFYVGGVITSELQTRIDANPNISYSYDMVRLIEDLNYRETFLDELFVHALRF